MPAPLDRAWEEEISDHEGRGLNDIERMTIDKINERTGSAADQLRQTYAAAAGQRLSLYAH